MSATAERDPWDLMPRVHCDSRVLHAPGACDFCDDRPDLQATRLAWGVAFTGQPPPDGGLPCPADAARPPGTERHHARWPGNRPSGYPPPPFGAGLLAAAAGEPPPPPPPPPTPAPRPGWRRALRARLLAAFRAAHGGTSAHG